MSKNYTISITEVSPERENPVRVPLFVRCPCKYNNILFDIVEGSGVIRIKCKRCGRMHEVKFNEEKP